MLLLRRSAAAPGRTSSYGTQTLTGLALAGFARVWNSPDSLPGGLCTEHGGRSGHPSGAPEL